ncbi:hypothetical protein JHK87_031674 [Glycine soja]|nr:hypothetical protein JHK87_031674 [Glycine soja]
MNSIRNVTQREKKLRHNLLLCLMPIAQFNHATDHQSLNNSTTSSSSRSSRQEQNYPYPQEDDEECFNFFMDEEDLSSSSSRHYYPYQPHPSSTTGIDDAFPFEFSSG